MGNLIYLDNAATTKPYPEAVAKAKEIMTIGWGNPSSEHGFGAQAKCEIEKSREIISAALGAQPKEIYFTSGGTEADNLAIFGACTAGAGGHIVTTAVEHSAVAKTVRNLRREHGFEISYIPLKNGGLDLELLEKSVTDETLLVSVMLVDNEVGTIFPLAVVSRIIKRKNPKVLLHCDAVQGFGKIPFAVNELGVDLLSISAHKIHGIQGSGALYVKEGTQLFARQFGGGQEKSLRSGTESVPLIAAFGEATRITFERMDDSLAQMTSMRDYCIAELRRHFNSVRILTDEACAPHIVSFTLPGVDAQETVRQLGAQGICISNGAACKSNEPPNPNKRGQALTSYGLTDAQIRSTLRVSLCAENTRADIDALIAALGAATASFAPFL